MSSTSNIALKLAYPFSLFFRLLFKSDRFRNFIRMEKQDDGSVVFQEKGMRRIMFWTITLQWFVLLGSFSMVFGGDLIRYIFTGVLLGLYITEKFAEALSASFDQIDGITVEMEEKDVKDSFIYKVFKEASNEIEH